MQQQVEGRLAFFQATLAKDWQTARDLIRQALAQDQAIPGARSFLGLYMSNEVQWSFFFELRGVTTPVAGLYKSLEAARSPARVAESGPYRNAPSTVEAITALTEALQHDDNPEGKVSADLALMYGISAAYEPMIEAIKQTRAVHAEQLTSLQMPERLAMLVYACGNDRQRIGQLGEALGYPLPASEEAIRASVDAIPAVTSENSVSWYAVEVPTMGQQASAFAATVLIFRLDHEGVSTAYAHIFPHSREMYVYPVSEKVSDQPRLPVPIPVPELVDRLTKRFMFICPGRGLV